MSRQLVLANLLACQEHQQLAGLEVVLLLLLQQWLSCDHAGKDPQHSTNLSITNVAHRQCYKSVRDCAGSGRWRCRHGSFRLGAACGVRMQTCDLTPFLGSWSVWCRDRLPMHVTVFDLDSLAIMRGYPIVHVALQQQACGNPVI